MGTKQIDKPNYYSNLKLYDEKGRRVAIFGKGRGNNLLIFVLTCSKADNFSKRVARNAYEGYLLDILIKDYNPHHYNIEIEDGKPKSTFLRWCSENYYKKATVQLSFQYGIGYIGRMKQSKDKEGKVNIQIETFNKRKYDKRKNKEDGERV